MLRLLVAVSALAVVLASTVNAQVPEGIPIGALRWDAWFEGAPDQKVFEQPKWRHRAPFFARWDKTGKVYLDGDMEHVLPRRAYRLDVSNYSLLGAQFVCRKMESEHGPDGSPCMH